MTRTAYGALRAELPYDLKKTLSGVRQYAEGQLDYAGRRASLTRRRFLEHESTAATAELRLLQDELDQLTLILFCHAVYAKFTYGDKLIKQSVGTFESLGIPEVRIGAVTLSKHSPLYNQGMRLAKGLLRTVRNRRLRSMIVRRAHWYEIADEFKRRVR